MATPRAVRTTPPSRLTTPRHAARHARPGLLPRAGAAGLAALTATATAWALLPATAAAEPSAAELERRVQALDVRASTAVEDFRQAEQQVQEAERRAAAAKARAAAEQARLHVARREVAGVAAAAYRRGGNDQIVAVLTESGPQDFLDRAAALDRIGRSQAEVMSHLETAVSRARSEQAAAQAHLDALRTAQRELDERRRQVERARAAQQQLLAGLEAQERRRVEAARDAAPRASRSRDTGPTPTYDGPASGRARVAVEEAHRQLGKPYRYGGDGPDSFDCSGLTSWVWRAAGVSLPRTSRDQYAQGRKVARADIQPGDLVYFGDPIHHVGIYIGDGQMISAPQSGDRVKIQSAFRSDFVGATRP
ncbi:MAG TPA: NlpC/P60 family protein [Mycobacteriales bacterium]|nr:NlpC/P60 family protein [Mycobacteriales bacterium]